MFTSRNEACGAAHRIILDDVRSFFSYLHIRSNPANMKSLVVPPMSLPPNGSGLALSSTPSTTRTRRCADQLDHFWLVYGRSVRAVSSAGFRRGYTRLPGQVPICPHRFRISQASGSFGVQQGMCLDDSTIPHPIGSHLAVTYDVAGEGSRFRGTVHLSESLRSMVSRRDTDKRHGKVSRLPVLSSKLASRITNPAFRNKSWFRKNLASHEGVAFAIFAAARFLLASKRR